MNNFKQFMEMENDHAELQSLIQETLEYNPTNEEIEKSFDEYHFIFESFDNKEMVAKLKKFEKDNKDLDDAISKSFEQQNKELAEVDKSHMDKVAKTDKNDFNGLYKLNQEHIKDRVKIMDDCTKRNEELHKKYGKSYSNSDPLDIIAYDAVRILNAINKERKNYHSKKDEIRDCMKKFGSDFAVKIYCSNLTSSFASNLNILNSDLNFFKKIDKEVNLDDVNGILKMVKLDKYLSYSDDNNVFFSPEDKLLAYFKFFTDVANGNDELLQDCIDDMSDSVSAENITDNKPVEMSKEDIEKDIKEGEGKEGSSDEESTEESEKQVEKDIQEEMTDNKDLLTPIAKEAGVTADKLSGILAKLCKTSKGKARKLQPSVITGLSIMICGALLTIKNNGKSDKKAITDVLNKLTEIVQGRSGVKKILEYKSFDNFMNI